MIEKMYDVGERIRLVVFGGPKVGKSAMVKRFLFNTFQEKYKPTIEELYNKEYEFGRITLKVDILDTAGDLQFPAMRRLSIATAHAFLLVYAIDDTGSLETVKGCFQEIQEQRADFADIPILVAGNKMDVPLTSIEVEFDDVSNWITDQMPALNTKIMECSAKQDKNVTQVFRSFIDLSKISLHIPEPEKQDVEVVPLSGLRRRLSAHVWSRNSQRSRKGRSNSSTPTTEPTTPESPTSQSSIFGLQKVPASPVNLSPNYLGAEDNSPFSRDKPRSRSLIRRYSRKVKRQVQDSTETTGDCQIA